MLQSKSIAVRMLSIAVTIMLLFAALLVNTESADAASKLKVTAGKKTICAEQNTKLTANQNVKWSVSNSRVAKLKVVNKKTVSVTGKKAGTVYIKAKAGKLSKKIRITVKPLVYTSTDYIGMGEYCNVFYKGIDGKVVYSSADESIATVSNKGLVYGLKAGETKVTVRSKSDKKIKGSVKIKVVAAKAGLITLNVDLSDPDRYPAGKTAKVWLPLPQNDRSQTIYAVSYVAPGAKVLKETKDSAGGKQVYIEWDKDTLPENRKATLKYRLYRSAIERDESIASNKATEVGKVAIPDEAKVALNETRWSGDLTKGIVKETADKIVAEAGAETVYEKAYAIYDYLCDNLTRIDDKKVIFGDVVSILEGKRQAGSCMDVNSVFVALCRAEGIPARNLFGLRFSPKCGPNCRAEFFLPDYGWVVADPALAIKQSWGHESEYIGKDAPKAEVWAGIKDKYWGNGEENWICINTGRDIWLDPKQEADTGGQYLDVLNPEGSINLYMFPYGEYGGQYIPCQDSANFKYEYSFEEMDPTDCGC